MSALMLDNRHRLSLGARLTWATFRHYVASVRARFRERFKRRPSVLAMDHDDVEEVHEGGKVSAGCTKTRPPLRPAPPARARDRGPVAYLDHFCESGVERGLAASRCSK